MTSLVRASHRPLLILALALAGCGEAADPNATPVAASATPSADVPPATPTEPTAAIAGEKTEVHETIPVPDAAPAPASTAKAEDKAEVKDGPFELQLVKFDDFRKRVANKDAKLTVVDVWATWCIPCKENFPHLVEMHKKLADKGLAVASLSFDDPAEAKQVNDAKEFLAAKDAKFPNYLLDEEQGVGYEKLDIGAIPAVFLYSPDGKELKRYTMDDPNNQFTYEQVEKDVLTLLDGKPLPATETAKPAEK